MASVHLENFKMREAQFILSSFCIIPLGLRKVGANMAITTWVFQEGLEDLLSSLSAYDTRLTLDHLSKRKALLSKVCLVILQSRASIHDFLIGP